MALENDQSESVNFTLLKHMLKHQQYYSMLDYIHIYKEWSNDRIEGLLELGHAYKHTDLKTINLIAPRLQLDFLTQPGKLEQRVYSSAQSLAIKIELREYDDYLRALTPLLVDVLRLVLEATVLPDLDRYLCEVIKETSDGNPLYRGLQWNEPLIEAKSNLIKSTWKHYYGDFFNYDHYVSSSHLVKLITDHVKNPQILEIADQMRKIEKYARNIVAHESVYVNDDWLKERVGMEAKQIHQLLVNLINLAGLTSAKQWQSMVIIDNEIEKELKNSYIKMTK
ncbi:hypothetical protein HZY91_09580 [Facklamia sp. DSM 111018]|uniref:Csm6 HEPN domain-containing protein n=1 Tax=Facklamia lactis TaxID=2749967 RepID=A0ABS0LSH8_9LACT|nr:hypothetical protein [Facklamia lactis]MBG9981406.1 hypothetical protein [Facklamia lactis]MBG9987118.1 hypothetical protein [Facklamia lactis]